MNVATDPTVATISTGSTQSFVIAYRNRNGAIGLAERRLDRGAGLRGAEVAEMSFEHHTLPPPAESRADRSRPARKAGRDRFHQDDRALRSVLTP
ncbi:hypothetical protein [Micromonospora sp. NPDC003241]